jgi:phage-related protein
MANDNISFKLETNLDEIVKQVKNLSTNVSKLSKTFERKNVLLTKQTKLEEQSSKTIGELASEYKDLDSSAESFVKKSKQIGDTYKNNQKNIKNMIDSIKNFDESLKKSITDEYDKDIEKRIKKIREIETKIADSILKTLDGIHKIGFQLTAEANHLKPFILTFMSSFSFNPMKFFGAGQAMKDAFDLMKMFQQMRHEMAYLSDSSGDASKAVSLIYEVAGGSAVASGTATGVIRSLVDQGLVVRSQIKSIGILSGDLQAATGLAASQWASFTGELAFNYGIPEKGLENIASALIGTNLRGAQLEKAMGTVNKVLQTTAFVAGKPTTNSIHGLTKAIGGSIKIFQSMGITAEKAGGFIEGIVDPENFEKNAFLFAKLGISASQYAEYLNDTNGQQKLLEKTMENLPKVASEIANMRNPYARLQLAKTLGLDMQIVRNMAGKTQAEIQQMLIEYQAENKANEALAEKRKRMASEAAKFDDMMLGLKLKVLAPIMSFLSGPYLKEFISILPTIAITIGRMFEAIVPIIKVLTDSFNELVPILANFVKDFVAPFIRAFPMILEYLLNKLPFLNTREGETGKESPTQKLYLIVGNILSYLTKLYLLVLAWKGLNFLGDTFNKIKGFFKPGQKRVMDATLEELAAAIRGQPLGGGGSLFSMLGLGSQALLAGGMFGAAYGTGNLLTRGLMSLVGMDYEKKAGDVYMPGFMGQQFMKALALSSLMEKYGSKGYIQSAGGFMPNLQARWTPSAAFSAPGYHPQERFGSTGIRNFGANLPYLMYGLEAGRFMMSDNREDAFGAVGAIGGDLATRMALYTGLPMLANASPSMAALLQKNYIKAGATVLPLVAGGLTEYGMSKIGAAYDDKLGPISESITARSQLVADNIALGIKNILSAFELGDMDTVSTQISFVLDQLIETILVKISSRTGLFKLSGEAGMASTEKAKEVKQDVEQKIKQSLSEFDNPENYFSKYRKEYQKREKDKPGSGYAYVMNQFSTDTKKVLDISDPNSTLFYIKSLSSVDKNEEEAKRSFYSNKDYSTIGANLAGNITNSQLELKKYLMNLTASQNKGNNISNEQLRIQRQQLEEAKKRMTAPEVIRTRVEAGNVPTIYGGFSAINRGSN